MLVHLFYCINSRGMQGPEEVNCTSEVRQLIAVQDHISIWRSCANIITSQLLHLYVVAIIMITMTNITIVNTCAVLWHPLCTLFVGIVPEKKRLHLGANLVRTSCQYSHCPFFSPLSNHSYFSTSFLVRRSHHLIFSHPRVSRDRNHFYVVCMWVKIGPRVCKIVQFWFCLFLLKLVENLWKTHPQSLHRTPCLKTPTRTWIALSLSIFTTIVGWLIENDQLDYGHYLIMTTTTMLMIMIMSMIFRPCCKSCTWVA